MKYRKEKAGYSHEKKQGRTKTHLHNDSPSERGLTKRLSCESHL